MYVYVCIFIIYIEYETHLFSTPGLSWDYITEVQKLEYYNEENQGKNLLYGFLRCV